MPSLPNRPTNPLEISFAARCFRIVGERVEWIVSNPTGWGYPKRFEDEAKAREWARVRHHQVTEKRVPIMERISWT